jgi:hypothetical protein
MCRFNDEQITDWLTKAAENAPGHFLAALWGAVMKVSDDDYCIIRPALMELKHKYELRPEFGDCRAFRRNEGA